MSMTAKNRTKSSWTPLSNETSNNKLFDERRALVRIWFDKWNSNQRKIILGDLIDRSKVKQLEFTRDVVQEKCPILHSDMTRALPRFLCLYIFSYLDPRSLSRCAQVCWYWKFLSELDQLWMPKCLRLGWYIPFTPGPYETGAWKRTYIEHLKSLKVLRPSTHLDLDKLNTDRKPPRSRGKQTPPPWRGSDPKPQDIWRNNILENDDYIDSVVKLREKGNYYGHESKKITSNAKSKVKTGTSLLTQSKRSKSAPRLTETAPAGLRWLDERPQWGSSIQPVQQNTVTFSPHRTVNGKHSPTGKENGFHSSRGIGTTSPAIKRNSALKETASSARDPPSTPLFPQQPWKVPDGDEEED